ncbi:unnamed protein product [Phytophthora lilii]|uniref:Unnamed protein product n=1 Tax=Phytophthora lilii TaxID=2077276 RepID=A0A9W6UC86_9STRA|nr:unnamed protein product [Phytophthora lilii]
MPVHAVRAITSYARCRPSLELTDSPEPAFKVEPTAVLRTRLDQFCKYPTPIRKTSPELRCPATYTRMSLSMEMDSPPATDEHVLSPLQYVRQGPSSILDDGRTMVTPISKHFNAGERYNPYRPKHQNLPVLPSFQTLQRSCSSSPGPDMGWSSSGSTPNQRDNDDQEWATPSPRSDEFVVSLGRTCAHMCL